MSRILAALTMTLAITAGAAVAHTRYFPTATSFGYDSARTDFLGQVNFPTGSGPCTTSRRIRVFRQRPGPDRLVGATRSDIRPGNGPGYWVVDVAGIRPGRFYAVVLRKDLAPGAAHAHICRAYRTSAIPFS